MVGVEDREASTRVGGCAASGFVTSRGDVHELTTALLHLLSHVCGPLSFEFAINVRPLGNAVSSPSRFEFWV